MRSGIVIFVLPAIGIDKMRILAAPLSDSFVHQVSKARLASGYCFTQSICRIIAGFKHSPVHKIAHSHDFSGFQPYGRAVLISLSRCFGCSDSLIRIQILKREPACQKLGGAVWFNPLVRILFIHELLQIQRIHSCCFCFNIGCFCLKISYRSNKRPALAFDWLFSLSKSTGRSHDKDEQHRKDHSY